MEERKVISWICLFLTSVTFCRSIEANVRHSRTMTDTFPAYAISGFAEHLNSTKCRKQMEEFRQAVDRRTLWALRMLDASGQVMPGFITGQNYWLGSQWDCEYLPKSVAIRYSKAYQRNNSLYRNPEEEYPPFDVNFFIGNMRHNSVLQYHMELWNENTIVLGLCLPATCTKHEVATMLNKMLDNGTLFVDELYSMNLILIGVSDLKDDHQWLRDGHIIVMLFVLVLLLAVVIVGTLYDIIVYQICLPETKCPPSSQENTNESAMTAQVQNESDDEKRKSRVEKPNTGIGHYLLCFSMYTNIQIICRMNRSPKNMNIFDGIKVLSVLWVDLIHNMLFFVQFIGNRAIVSHMASSLLLQIIYNGTYVVDTFFFISGFFLFRHFRLMRTRQNETMNMIEKCKAFSTAIFDRYIRLAPVYYVVLFLSIIIFTWQKQVSVFNGTDEISGVCSKYWWRNILFINNLFDWDQMCVIWSWYVPNDMQFYIFGCFLTMLAMTHYYIGLSIGAISIVGCILGNAYIAYHSNYTSSLDEFYTLEKNLYAFPWLRISPYLIGMGTCLLLEKWNYVLNLSKKAVIVIWIVAFFMLFATIFGLIGESISLGYSVFYTALSRTCWALGIAWIVIACSTNNAGFIEKILSWEVWYPLSKLSYSSYLVNPFIITTLGNTSNYPIFVNAVPLQFVMWFGTTTATYIAALLLTAAVEVPCFRLLKS